MTKTPSVFPPRGAFPPKTHILALAMAMAERLGIHSSAALNDDVLYKIAHVYTKRFAHLGQGQRTLMGLW